MRTEKNRSETNGFGKKVKIFSREFISIKTVTRRVGMKTKYLISGSVALLCLLACAISADDQRLDENRVQKENSSLNADNDKFHKDSIYLLPYISLLPFTKSKETQEFGCLLGRRKRFFGGGNNLE